MAVHVIKVPDVGEGIAEVELVDWHVAPGDTVQEDQALADVMTDKASVEIPSPVAGRVLDLGAAVGQMMAVGAVLIRIETGAAQASGQVPAAAPTKPVATPPAVPPAAVPAAAVPAPATAPAESPPPLRPAQAPAAATAPAARPSTAPPSAGHAIASPALRRRAWELGVDLNQVTATGTAGRVTQADLDAFVAAGGAQPLAPARVSAAPSTAREDEEAIPVIGLRRRIALQMQESKRRIPHFSYVEEVDVTELEATRAALNAKWAADRGKLTLLPLLMRAVVLAVRDFGLVNARFDDEKGVITRYGAVHIGVATDTRHGLLVPVVRHCEDAQPVGHGSRTVPPGTDRACGASHARRTQRLHHHHQQPGRAGRHRVHARHQPARGGHHRCQSHGRAAHAARRRGGGAADDEPVLVLRPPCGGRHRRGAFHPGRAPVAGNARAAVRGRGLIQLPAAP
jgi:2-oxoisovalerate dehydrogenase E2 component (dihydrolipoyl transacylase)